MATKTNPRRRCHRSRRNPPDARSKSDEVDVLTTLGWSVLSAVVVTTATYYIMREIYVTEVMDSCGKILRGPQQATPTPQQLERHARSIL